MSLRERVAAPWVMPVTAVFWLAVTSWVRPLSVPDEGRYLGVAWEMVRSGNWLVPTLDGLPYFHKPPLFYWISGASMQLFGVNHFAGRAAALLGAATGAIALYLFARRWAADQVATASLVALVTQPLIFLAAQFANLDMLVAGLIGATILSLAHCVLAAEQGRDNRFVLALAYLFAALGMMAKGLIGVVLPMMVIGAWLLADGRLRSVERLLWLPGMLLFLVVVAPWFIAVQLRFPEFLHYFFVVQHFQRYAVGGFNNVQPLWFFPVVLALLAMPWSAWLVAAASRAPRFGPEGRSVRRLMWIWLGVITLFFSIPSSKLVGYILPVGAPLAFLAGDAAVLLSAGSSRLGQLVWLSAGGAAAICLSLVVGLALFSDAREQDIGIALRGEVKPGDQIIYVDQYFFAIAFYAQLSDPVIVVTDWSSPEAHRDNWRKELLDAQEFAGGAKVTASAQTMDRKICGPAASWVIGGQAALAAFNWPPGSREVAISRDTALWHVPVAPAAEVSSGRCPGRPNGNSITKS